MKIKSSLTIGFSFICSLISGQPHDDFIYSPSTYVCQKSTNALTIDGNLTESDWKNAPWTAEFVDIEGDIKPDPAFATRVKMLWDENYFFIGAELIEEHIWATYDQRDAVIFHENDFEVFIDPDGDTHNYYELEINALGTVWDLLLTKPYRDKGGRAITGWDIAGLKKGIALDGTLNDPGDTDNKWTIELALPWEILKEAAPERRKPRDGDTWRVNFSRVHWQIEASGEQYVKTLDPRTKKPFPENNWVWSPQGIIAMHQPETWGFVQFSDKPIAKGIASFSPDPHDPIKWLLRQVYYAQSRFKDENGSYASSISQLDLDESDQLKKIEIYTTSSGFEAVHRDVSLWIIRDDGYIFSLKGR